MGLLSAGVDWERSNVLERGAPLDMSALPMSDVSMRRVGPIGLAIAAAILSGIAFFSSTLEDALITFRYAERWSEGYAFGMWNRVGDPVEGFTSFLWMILLAFAGPDANSIANAAKAIGLAAHLGLILLFFSLHRDMLRRDRSAPTWVIGDPTAFASACFATALALGVCLPLSWYAVSGMETVPFALLIALSVFLPLLTARRVPLLLVGIAITLIRPEGVFFATAAAAFWYFVTRERRMLAVLGAALATFCLLSAFRLDHFGALLPNTYYAKASDPEGFGHLWAGIRYFRDAGMFYWMLTFPLAAFLVVRLFRRQRLPALLWFLLASQLASIGLVAQAGGDNIFAFPLYRHLLVLLPLLVLSTFLLVFALPTLRVAFSSAILVCLLVFPAFESPMKNELLRIRDRAFAGDLLAHEFTDADLVRWLAAVVDDDTVVATSLAGQIPFIVDAIHIDVLGLNDTRIAHFGRFDPYGPVDSKTDMSLVIDRDPDIIEGYMRASQLLFGDPVRAIFGARAKMNVELLNDPRFRADYLMVTNAPYETLDRILFVRRAWLENRGARSGVKAVDLDRVISAFDTADHWKKTRLLGAGN